MDGVKEDNFNIQMLRKTLIEIKYRFKEKRKGEKTMLFAIESVTDTNKYLYHYTTMETLLFYILPQKQLRFSEMKKTNDPQEVTNRVFDYQCDNRAIDTDFEGLMDDFDKLEKDFSEALLKNIKILCFSQDTYIPEGDINSIVYPGLGQYKPRMWAQYANNQQGICLVLKKDKLIELFNKQFKDSFHFSEGVNYGFDNKSHKKSLEAYEIRQSDIDEYSIQEIIDKKISEYNDIFYFTKHPDWRDETEYRFVIRSEVEQFISIDGIIDSIILGINTDNNILKPLEILINEFIEKPDIYKLKSNFGYYDVDKLYL